MKTRLICRGIALLPGVIVLFGVLSVPAWCFGQEDWRAAILSKMESQYPLSKPTADRSDIVTAGAVLTLLKDDLLLYPPSIRYPISNTYKDGKISINFLGKLSVARKFVRGEKFWVTKIIVKDDGLYFEFLSDPFDDTRYSGSLKFPFQKGAPPPADQVEKLVAQVLKADGGAPVQAAGTGPAARQAGGSPAGAPPAAAYATDAPAAPEPVMPVIAPPPPPADQPPPPPKEIKLGMTKDQVIAAFGQPTRMASLATKLIFYYPDLKVTFVNGKVSDVQ